MDSNWRNNIKQNARRLGIGATKRGTEKTMTARDVTGFYAFFSAWKSGNFPPHFGGISLLKCTVSLETRGKIHWRKFIQKSSGDFDRNHKFLSLVVVQSVLKKN